MRFRNIDPFAIRRRRQAPTTSPSNADGSLEVAPETVPATSHCRIEVDLPPRMRSIAEMTRDSNECCE